MPRHRRMSSRASPRWRTPKAKSAFLNCSMHIAPLHVRAFARLICGLPLVWRKSRWSGRWETRYGRESVVRHGGCASVGNSVRRVERSRRPPENGELDPLAVTRWTDKTELFAEYPPLVVGQTSRFAIHLTDLRTFKAVTAGQVEVQLQGSGAPEMFRVDGPSRPGNFRRRCEAVSRRKPGARDCVEIGGPRR